MMRLDRIGLVVLIGVLAGTSSAWTRPQSASDLTSAEIADLTEFVVEGDAAFEAGNYEAAVAAYARVSPIQVPVPAQNRLAMSYHLLGKLREAEALYRLAAARNGEYAPAHSNLGALYYARGEFKDAEEQFRSALKYDPRVPVTERNLHAARYARENSRQARDRIALLPAEDQLLLEGVEGEFFRVTLLMESQTQDELDDLALRGDVFIARKMFEDAIVEYERYLDLDEYDAQVRNKLGITYQQAQRVADAEGEYRQALKLNPYFVPALNNLGAIEQGRRNYLQALDYYRRALEVDEDSSTVLQNLGACLFSLERYEDGLVAYMRAIQLDPTLFDRLGGGGGSLVQTVPGNESMTNFYLAKLFARIGDMDRTMSFLYRAVEEGFDQPKMLRDPAFSALETDDRFMRLVASLAEES